MKTKIIIASSVASSIAAYLYFKKRRKNMSGKITATEIITKESEERMGRVEAERLISAVKAMDEQQLEVMLDQVPIELIFKRMQKEFNKQKEFIQSVQNSMHILQ